MGWLRGDLSEDHSDTSNPPTVSSGNIAGPELRAWVDDLCEGLNRKPIYPLWDEDPVELFWNFINEGFEAHIVKIDSEQIESGWLGEPIDEDFFNDLLAKNLHPMGKFGEYHTLTVDGPIFETPIPVEIDWEDTS